jgi:hypothetical protein
MSGVLDPGSAGRAIVDLELKEEQAAKQNKKDRLNRTIRRDPVTNAPINNYCPCKLEGCRRPALLVTGSEYCPEHFKLGSKIEAGDFGTIDVSRFTGKNAVESDPNAHVYHEMDRARQHKKAQAKHNKRALLAQLAYNSGNPKEFMRLRALERLKRGGRIEKVFARIDTDGNGYIDFDELKGIRTNNLLLPRISTY